MSMRRSNMTPVLTLVPSRYLISLLTPCLKSQDISAPDYDGRRSKMTETPEILQHDLQTARTSMLIYRLAAGAALLL